MNLYDPEGSRRMGMDMRYEKFRKLERRGLTYEDTATTPPASMPADLNRAVRWRSFFRFQALTHRHTERPSYI